MSDKNKERGVYILRNQLQHKGNENKFDSLFSHVTDHFAQCVAETEEDGLEEISQRNLNLKQIGRT